MLTALLCLLGVAYVGVAGAVHARIKNKHKLDHFASFLLAAAWPAALPHSMSYGRVNDRFLAAAAAERRERLALMEHSGELDPDHLVEDKRFVAVCSCGYRSGWYGEEIAEKHFIEHGLSCDEGQVRLWKRER